MDPREPFRRASPQKLALAAVGVVGLALLLGALWRWSVAALRDLPAYRLTLRDVTLDPDVPPWFRGGRAAFLDGVATLSGEQGELSTLDPNLAKDVKVAFKQSPWVESVERVEVTVGPKVLVRLAYREPVAFNVRDKAPPFLVDRDGVIVPSADVSDEEAERLVQLIPLTSPVNPRNGQSWMRENPDSAIAEVDNAVAAAARIASLAKARPLRGADPDGGVVKVLVHAVGTNEVVRAFVQLGRVMIAWPKADPAADEGRWTAVADWARLHPKEIASKTNLYLEFGKNGLRPYVPRESDGREKRAG